MVHQKPIKYTTAQQAEIRDRLQSDDEDDANPDSDQHGV